MNEKNLYDLGALYHDYSVFGVKNDQLPGIFKPNQQAKAPIITAYIQYAIAKCKQTIDTSVSFAEMFCADGYYAMLARHLGADYSTGVDNGKDDFFNYAPQIAERIGIKNIEFILKDVNLVDTLEKVDIVANVGGLYHVSNPKEIVIKSYSFAKQYLILQSVVSLATNDKNYLETPAPGWDWGSRMSRESFHKMIIDLDYTIIDQHFNELEGNDRLEDRGSVYYLIKVEHEKKKKGFLSKWIK